MILLRDNPAFCEVLKTARHVTIQDFEKAFGVGYAEAREAVFALVDVQYLIIDDGRYSVTDKLRVFLGAEPVKPNAILQRALDNIARREQAEHDERISRGVSSLLKSESVMMLPLQTDKVPKKRAPRLKKDVLDLLGVAAFRDLVAASSHLTVREISRTVFHVGPCGLGSANYRIVDKAVYALVRQNLLVVDPSARFAYRVTDELKALCHASSR